MSDEMESAGGDEQAGPGARVVLLVVLATAVGAFVVQNTESAQVDWFVFDFSLPLWALVIASAVVGIVLRDLVMWFRHRRG